MNNFQEMSKGLMDWHEKYNSDMGGIYSEMAATKSNGILNTYTHSKEGTVHSLTGEGAIMRFFTSAPWEAGDTITVNGEAVEPKTLDGQALPSGAFVTGMWAVAVKDGATLQFLTQSYAGAFADIQTQLSNKTQYIVYQDSVFDFDSPGKGYGIYRLFSYGPTAEWANGPLTTDQHPAGTLIYGCGAHDLWEQELFLCQYGGLFYRTSYDSYEERVWSP